MGARRLAIAASDASDAAPPDAMAAATRERPDAGAEK